MSAFPYVDFNLEFEAQVSNFVTPILVFDDESRTMYYNLGGSYYNMTLWMGDVCRNVQIFHRDIYHTVRRDLRSRSSSGYTTVQTNIIVDSNLGWSFTQHKYGVDKHLLTLGLLNHDMFYVGRLTGGDAPMFHQVGDIGLWSLSRVTAVDVGVLRHASRVQQLHVVPTLTDIRKTDRYSWIELDLNLLRYSAFAVNSHIGADKINRVVRCGALTVDDIATLSASVSGRGRQVANRLRSLFQSVVVIHRNIFNYPAAGHLIAGFGLAVLNDVGRTQIWPHILGFMWYDLACLPPICSDRSGRAKWFFSLPMTYFRNHTVDEYFQATMWLADAGGYLDEHRHDFKGNDALRSMFYDRSFDSHVCHELIQQLVGMWFKKQGDYYPALELSPEHHLRMRYVGGLVGLACGDGDLEMPMDEIAHKNRYSGSLWVNIPCGGGKTWLCKQMAVLGIDCLDFDDIPVHDPNGVNFQAAVRGEIPWSAYSRRVRPIVSFKQYRVVLSHTTMEDACVEKTGWCELTIDPKTIPFHKVPASPEQVYNNAGWGGGCSIWDMFSTLGSLVRHSLHSAEEVLVPVPASAFTLTDTPYYVGIHNTLSAWAWAQMTGMHPTLKNCTRGYKTVRDALLAPLTMSLPLPHHMLAESRRCMACWDDCWISIDIRSCMVFESHFYCPSCIHMSCPIPGCKKPGAHGSFLYPRKRHRDDPNRIELFEDGPDVLLHTSTYGHCTENTPYRSLRLLPVVSNDITIPVPSCSFIEGDIRSFRRCIIRRQLGEQSEVYEE